MMTPEPCPSAWPLWTVIDTTLGATALAVAVQSGAPHGPGSPAARSSRCSGWWRPGSTRAGVACRVGVRAAAGEGGGEDRDRGHLAEAPVRLRLGSGASGWPVACGVAAVAAGAARRGVAVPVGALLVRVRGSEGSSKGLRGRRRLTGRGPRRGRGGLLRRGRRLRGDAGGLSGALVAPVGSAGTTGGPGPLVASAPGLASGSGWMSCWVMVSPLLWVTFL